MPVDRFSTTMGGSKALSGEQGGERAGCCGSYFISRFAGFLMSSLSAEISKWIDEVSNKNKYVGEEVGTSKSSPEELILSSTFLARFVA